MSSKTAPTPQKRYPWTRDKRAVNARVSPEVYARIEERGVAAGKSVSRVVGEILTHAVQSPAAPAPEADGF